VQVQKFFPPVAGFRPSVPVMFLLRLHHCLLMPSRKPSTNFQTLLLTGAEPCHSSSNGWSPIAGYPPKNWRTTCSRLHFTYILNFMFFCNFIHSPQGLIFFFWVVHMSAYFCAWVGYMRSRGYYVLTVPRCMCCVNHRWLVHMAGRASPLHTCCHGGILWQRAG